MPRYRPKKGKPYKEEDLQKAIEEVVKNIEEEKKFSKRAIAKKYGINKDVLSRHLQGKAQGVAGRPTAIPVAEEEELASSLKTMSKWGFGLLKDEIKDVIQEYVTVNKVKTPFKNNRPGDDWFVAFCRRHKLTIKKPEALEVTRRQVTSDPFIIYKFYKTLEDEVKKLKLENKPGQVYNLDESGFQMDPSKTKVVTEKGKPAHRLIQGSGRENTTVLACVNAEGKALPPLVIYQANKFWSSWIGEESKGMIKGTFFGVSPTGWMNSTLFQEWFSLFVKQVEERPLLLLFDGHLSHLDIGTIELARSNNITILKLPPHTTDLLQPLDKSVFGPLKTAYDKRLHIYQREQQEKLSKSDFVNVLGSVWSIGLSQENILSGFKKSGIFPVDAERYPKNRLDPEKLSRYLANQSVSAADNEQPGTSSGLVYDSQRATGPMANDNEPFGETSTPSTSSSVNANDDEPLGRTTCTLSANSSVCEDSVSNIQSCSTSPKDNSLTQKRSFEDLLLHKVTPKTHKPKQKRRKIDVDGVVITSDEYAAKIKKLAEKKKKDEEQKEARKKAREEKREQSKKLKEAKTKLNISKKPVSKMDTSSSEDEISEGELCQEMSDGPIYFSEDDEDEQKLLKLNTFKVPSNARQIMLHQKKVKDNIDVMQVFAVYFDQSFYLGQVQKVFYKCEEEVPDNMTMVEVKYLKWCGENKYKWPVKEEVELVEPKYIFHGPIETTSFDPFQVEGIESIRSLYTNLKKMRDDIYPTELRMKNTC